MNSTRGSMYRLLVVDDEYEIRQGLEAFDWGAYGISLAGSHAHGLEAFQRMMADPVDILLTDIRMPFMDGFELIRQGTWHFPYLKTVILTGFGDFSYARQGIRLGISDYLLKPAKEKDIGETFGRVVRELDLKRQQDVRNETLERKARLSAGLLRRQFMEKLLFRSVSPERLEEGAAGAEMLLEGAGYIVAMLRLDRKAEDKEFHSQTEWKLIVFALDNLLAEYWDHPTGGYHWIHPDSGECFLLYVHRDAPTADPYAAPAEALSAAASNVRRLRGLHLSTVSTAIGPFVPAAKDIRASALTAAQALRSRQGKEHQLVRTAIDSALPDDRPGAEREMEEAPREGAAQSIIEEAKCYIDRNYDKSVTLQDLAAHVHVNANYLSTLFRKTTGQNYIQYLTDLRIRQAMRLLKETDRKVYEICEKVGYANTAYFTDLFRKHTGRTPNEFRGVRGREGEEPN